MISYIIDFFKQDVVTFRGKIKQEWAFYSRQEQRRALIIICLVALLIILALFSVLGSVAYFLFQLVPGGGFVFIQHIESSELFGIAVGFAGVSFIVFFALSAFCSSAR